ncbi:hypothetical protein D3C87_1265920 [compost metagenome]
MRVGHHVLGVKDAARRDGVFDHQVFQFLNRQGRGPLADQNVQFRLMLAARQVGGVARIGRQFGSTHGGAQAGEDGVLIGPDQVFAVRAGIDVRRRDFGQDRARAGALVAVDGVFRDHALHDLQHAFVQGAVDHLALTGALAVLQRRQRAHAAVGRRQRVADGYPHPRRGAVRLADDAAPAAHGLADAAEAGARRIGAGLAVTRDPHHDQTRVGLHEIGGGQAPLLQRAGTEVLDQDVGLGDQVTRRLLALGRAQIDGDGILVAGDHPPPGRGLALAPVAHWIADAGRFQLDHLGAHVAQQLTAEGTGDQLAHLDDLQPVQGAVQRLAGHGRILQNVN